MTHYLLEFILCFCLFYHVLNSVLIAEPIGALDRVVEVVLPFVLVHVSESSVDATLSGHGVRTRGKEFGDDGRLEAGIGETVGCAKTRTTSANHNGVVRMIDYTIVGFLK